MNIIKPYNFAETSEELLLNEKKIILKDNNNFSFYASIFPKSKIDNSVDFLYKKDRIITLIDDSIFTEMGFVLLDKENSIIIENNKRFYINSKTYGDYNDSVKRYTNLSKPVDINNNTQDFLNIPKPRQRQDKTDIKLDDLTFKTDIDILNFGNTSSPDLFEDNINHPHIQKYKLKNKPFKYNNKNYIIEVLKWAKDKGIKYIYCINESRPYIQNKNYVAPYIYYTIKGF